MSDTELLECLDGPDDCEGLIEYHSTDPGVRPAFPRCEKHWNKRLDSIENSMERYADSDLPPSWFDPSYAGERWDDDY